MENRRIAQIEYHQQEMKRVQTDCTSTSNNIHAKEVELCKAEIGQLRNLIRDREQDSAGREETHKNMMRQVSKDY